MRYQKIGSRTIHYSAVSSIGYWYFHSVGHLGLIIDAESQAGHPWTPRQIQVNLQMTYPRKKVIFLIEREYLKRDAWKEILGRAIFEVEYLIEIPEQKDGLKPTPPAIFIQQKGFICSPRLLSIPTNADGENRSAVVCWNVDMSNRKYFLSKTRTSFHVTLKYLARNKLSIFVFRFS